MKKLFIFLFLMLFVAPLYVKAQTAIVWVQNDSLTRVSKTVVAGGTTAITLNCARGEYCSAQIMLSSCNSVNCAESLAGAGTITGPTAPLIITPLTGPGTATIPASNIVAYSEFFTTVTGTNGVTGTNTPLGNGTYPEPLIPFVDPETGASLCGHGNAIQACSLTVTSGNTQPYWVDFFIPRGATTTPPGTYTGTVTIVNSYSTVAVPVTITVWNFELPIVPTAKSYWTSWNPYLTILGVGSATTNLQTLDRALMANRVMGRNVNASDAAADISGFGLSRSGLEGYGYFESSSCGTYPSIASSSTLTGYASNFPTGLPMDIYIGDELNSCSGADTFLKGQAAQAHLATCTGGSTCITTWATFNSATADTNLYSDGVTSGPAIDHWALLDSMQQWPTLPWTNPGVLLSYTSCNYGFGNAPEPMLDYPLIDERHQTGFLNYKMGAVGTLYYRADSWIATGGGNTTVDYTNLNRSACSTGSGPGDGVFVYSPGPIGSTEPAPGMRLKATRDGIQDFEYATILTALGYAGDVATYIAPTATSWTSWTSTIATLIATRNNIGTEINTKMGGGGGGGSPTPGTTINLGVTVNPGVTHQ